jgi:hypothetical protein
VMKDTIGTGWCFGDLQQLYQCTRRVLMAHQERAIYAFHIGSTFYLGLCGLCLSARLSPSPLALSRLGELTE